MDVQKDFRDLLELFIENKVEFIYQGCDLEVGDYCYSPHRRDARASGARGWLDLFTCVDRLNKSL